MNRTILRVLFLLAILTIPVAAGQLDPALSLKIASGTGKVRVWIKLPETSDVRAARAAVESIASPQERHRATVVALKDNHERAQAGVVRSLRTLESSGRVTGIKQHWSVNVVEAEIDVSELSALAARGDIDFIQEQPEITLIAPMDNSGRPEAMQLVPDVSYYSPNLIHIKADQAHGMGYTGKGRVVCSFDTGILGGHPFLNRNWRGKGGSRADSIASWFDPADHLTAPHIPSKTFASPTGHGTHVMGIMVGRNVAGDSTIGVAPDAKWISAGVVDCDGVSLLDAFDWAADPDGDPNTLDDVPDVVNHSWGEKASWVQCKDIFFDAIDNLEALGIVNIFAAGNDGTSGTQTIVNPANRALDSLDCFAVGHLNSATDTIAATSSRGPSGCNLATKPNVVAPGTAILSSYTGNVLATLSGTSMAAPHVAGLVALLRQKNPAATPAQIKQAILTSTRRIGAWGTMPNNIYGWGEIDCVAALNALAGPSAGAPDLRLYDFAHNSILPGGTVAGKLSVLNLGGAAKNDTALITGSDPSLTILDGLAAFPGTIATDSVSIAGDSIKIQVSDTVTAGRMISVALTLISHDATTNARSTKVASLAILVEPASTKSVATHTINAIDFSLSNYGSYGLGPGSMYSAGGVGFKFGSGGNDFFEAGLMLGTDSFTLASSVHDQLWEPSNDFRPAPGGTMQLNAPGTQASEQTFGKFTDAGSKQPLGVEVTQESFEYGPGTDAFVLMRYIVKNGSVSDISNLRLGLFLDWDIVNYVRNQGGFNETDSILWMAYALAKNPLPAPNNFRGAIVLDKKPTTATTQLWDPINPAVSGGTGYSRGAKFRALADGFATAHTHDVDNTNLYQVIASTLGIKAGKSDTVTFALIAGDQYTDLQAAAVAAKTAFNTHFPRAPLAFNAISPKVGSGSPSPTLLPTFVWQRAVDPNPNDTVTYTLEYATDSIFTPAVTTTVGNIADTAFTATDSLADLTTYWWKVTAQDQTGQSRQIGNVVSFVTDVASDVNDPGGNGLPKRFALYQNYPNPFNPSTVIAFDLPRASDYTLEIFDLLGRSVHQAQGRGSAGRVQVTWDGSRAGSGIYLYRVTAGNFSASRKMVLIK
ncbi:MAG: S8 family serine peptidase [Candidatus Zixiibacteriota bacterium]